MSLGHTVELNNGLKIPLIGFGTWLAAPGEVGQATEHALKTGYRHLDLARVYKNQAEIGDAIRRSGVPRSDIFITSKLWNNGHAPENVEKDLDLTLKQSGLDYLDLYLMHFPVSFVPSSKGLDDVFPEDPEKPGFTKLDTKTTVVDTWKAMIALLKTQKVRSIGVSNFTVEHLKTIIDETGVVPVVNQIERHPRLGQNELVEWAYNEHKIYSEAYSPLANNELGEPKVIDHDEFKAYSSKLGKDPGQVAISWGRKLPAAKTKSGKDIPVIVLTKSVTPKRIELNFDDFELTDEQYKTIDEELVPKLGGEKRFNVPNKYSPSWGVNIWNDPREHDAYAKVNLK